jgi:hypothetical protein
MTSNAGTIWTMCEEREFTAELNAGVKIAKIAEWHNRTSGAMVARRTKIAMRMLATGAAPTEVMWRLNLTPTQFINITRVPS